MHGPNLLKLVIYNYVSKFKLSDLTYDTFRYNIKNMVVV